MADLELIVPPPIIPLEAPNQAEWESVEAIFTVLPSDYKAILSRYGTGRFCNFIWLHNPVSSNDYLNLVKQQHAYRSSFLRAKNQFPDARFPTLFPDQGGLLIAGGTDNGDLIYWRLNGDPDDWTVEVREARGPMVFEFDGGIKSFLAAVISKAIRCSVFPDSFGEEPPEFLSSIG